MSAWESTIKKALGRLRAPDDLPERLAAGRLAPLDVTTARALAVAKLPAHHADPFDRLLVAQARVDQQTLVTRDAHIRRYDVKTLLG